MILIWLITIIINDNNNNDLATKIIQYISISFTAFQALQGGATPETPSGFVRVRQTTRGSQCKVFVDKALFLIRHICIDEGFILPKMYAKDHLKYI